MGFKGLGTSVCELRALGCGRRPFLAGIRQLDSGAECRGKPYLLYALIGFRRAAKSSLVIGESRKEEVATAARIEGLVEALVKHVDKLVCFA